jgi:hypothetical protein
MIIIVIVEQVSEEIKQYGKYLRGTKGSGISVRIRIVEKNCERIIRLEDLNPTLNKHLFSSLFVHPDLTCPQIINFYTHLYIDLKVKSI